MKRSVGRRLDAITASLGHLERMNEVFQPGRGTRTDDGAVPITPLRGRVPPVRRAAPARGVVWDRADELGDTFEQGGGPNALPPAGWVPRPAGSTEPFDEARVAEQLDALCALWQIVQDLERDGDRRGQTLRASAARRFARGCEEGDLGRSLEKVLTTLAPAMRRRDRDARRGHPSDATRRPTAPLEERTEPRRR